MSFKLPIIENDEMPPVEKAETPPKQSVYLAAGSPTRCFLPSCGKAFDGACYRGDDQHYYCSELCANEGIDLEHVIVPIGKRTTHRR
jgi:hypothetical protein